MRIIIFMMLIISILCVFSSCSDKSKYKVRVIELAHNPYTGVYGVIDSSIHLLEVDTAYKIGDVLNDGGQYYKITN